MSRNFIQKIRKPIKRTNLPVKLPDNVTWLKQPNIITLMSCDLNKMHLRVVITLIEALQVDMNRRIGGVPFGQLSIFQEEEDETKIIKISIPIRNFGVIPSHYPRLREATKDLSKLPVEIDVTHPETGDATFNTSLFSAMIPKEGSQRKNIIFRIEREVAKCLLQIDLTKNLGYTHYIKEIALTARSKYTIRMYMLISSWKSKGGFSMDVDKFKHWLQIDPAEYGEWKDIEKRVLRTAEEELLERADCWFHYSPVFDQDVSLKTPCRIDFKVISANRQDDEKVLSNVKQSLYHVFINLKLSAKQAAEIKESLTIYNYMLIRDKIISISAYIDENRNSIRSIPEYFYKSIMSYINELNEE